MKIPELKETICGFSLRKGALFIAVISVALGVITILAGICGVYDVMYNYEAEYKERYSHMGIQYDTEDYERMLENKLEKGFEMGVILTLFIIHGIVSTFLLIGVQKKKPNYMLPWIWVCGLGIIFNFFVIFNNGFNNYGIDRDNFQMIVIEALQVYIFLIIYNYCKELKNESSDNNILSQQILTHEAILANDAPIKPTNNSIA